MIRVLFFGRLGEIAGMPETIFEHCAALATVNDLHDAITRENPELGRALVEPQVTIAVNREIAEWNAALEAGDEVAFLPPVTGG